MTHVFVCELFKNPCVFKGSSSSISASTVSGYPLSAISSRSQSHLQREPLSLSSPFPQARRAPRSRLFPWPRPLDPTTFLASRSQALGAGVQPHRQPPLPILMALSRSGQSSPKIHNMLSTYLLALALCVCRPSRLSDLPNTQMHSCLFSVGGS